MLYFVKKQFTLPTGKTEFQVKESLKASSLFFVTEGDGLMLRRGRALPSRGITRLLIPRVISKLSSNSNGLTLSFGLDSLASLMLVLLLGATVVDLTLSREVYPRDYPPGFISVLVLIYVTAIIYDYIATSQAIKKLIFQK